MPSNGRARLLISVALGWAPASAAIVKPALSASAQHEALPRPLRVCMACRIEGAAA